MERESQLKSASAEQTVEKGKEVKEASGEKLAVAKPCIFARQSAGHAANAAKKGWGTAPAGACGSGAPLADNRAESAALSAQTPPQGQCRGMCRAKRPPKAAVRGERGQGTCWQATWRVPGFKVARAVRYKLLRSFALRVLPHKAPCPRGTADLPGGAHFPPLW